jgi:hypothetical protein
MAHKGRVLGGGERQAITRKGSVGGYQLKPDIHIFGNATVNSSMYTINVN